MAEYSCTSGVGEVTASTPFRMNALPDMWSTQEVMSMARAVSAGFTKLQPMPPNIIFTSSIASAEPTAGSHSGTPAGRL